MFELLWPDFHYTDDYDDERDAAAHDAHLHIYGAGPGNLPVPEEIWGQADGIVVYGQLGVATADLGKLSRCRIVVRGGVGFDSLDLEGLGRHGIAACNVPDYGTMEVADFAITLALNLNRGAAFYDTRLRADPVGNWRSKHPTLSRRLRVSRFGVVGLGRIGLAAALRAKALGMQVGFYDPYLPTGAEYSVGLDRYASLEALLAESDVVSLHTPLNAETRNMINAQTIQAAKPGVMIINTARGELVDLDALYAGLKSGVIGGAGLDVLPEEPPDPDHPLIQAWSTREEWLEGRLLITPHIAYRTPESMSDLRRKTVEVVLSYLRDGRLINCVNESYLRAR